MAEIKNIPELRFPEYTGEWNEKLLCNLFSIGSGKDYKHLDKGSIPVYGTGGYMTSVNDYLYDGVSVCIGRKGTIDKPILLEGKFWTVDTLFFTHSYKKTIPRFIFFQFQRINWKRYNEASGVPSLSKSTIEKIKIFTPQVKEQEKIAAFLTAIDKRISLLTQQKEQLELYKKGLMQKIFSRELRFKDENGKDFPEWEDTSLFKVGNIITGKTPSTTDDNLWNGDIQFITPTDIKNDEKYLEKTERYVQNHRSLRVLPAKTIVYTCIASIGKMCITTKSAITNQQINSLIVYESFDIEFVYYSLLHITPIIKSTQANTTLPIINKTEFSKFFISIPKSKLEQQKISTFLSKVDREINSINKEINISNKFKKGLFQKMFV